MYLNLGISEPNKEKLTRFEQWWGNLLPSPLKKILPPWPISMGLVTLMALYSKEPTYMTMIMLLWASMLFVAIFRKLRPQIGQWRWIIPMYHVLLSLLVVKPAFAQAATAACSNSGLFAGVTNFVDGLFSTVSFGGVGGGTLSSLICQVVGFLTIALVLAFLGVLGYVSYQIGYQRQPIASALDPLMGFLVFAGGSTIIIGVMLGTGGTV
ncbi:MAG: hypothetical protein AAGF26_13345 [Cyanobacteria bacterium P01_G01_bin.49]